MMFRFLRNLFRRDRSPLFIRLRSGGIAPERTRVFCDGRVRAFYDVTDVPVAVEVLR